VRGHDITTWDTNQDGITIPVHNFDPSIVYLWHPPPAAADVAIEQLSFSRMKHPSLTHIFLCPCLMTHLWRKKLLKLADLVFSLPVGVRPAVWPSCMFEPLVVGIILPHLSVAPWSCRSTPALLAVGQGSPSVQAGPEQRSLNDTVPMRLVPFLADLWPPPSTRFPSG
jgi:hypothetical protein